MNHLTTSTTLYYRLSLRALLLSSVALFVLFSPANAQASGLSAQLPDIGKAGASVLSPREEQQLGREFMHSVQQTLKLVDDPPTVDYLQSLANRLVASLQQSHQPITIFLVDDPSINAFAGPGGFIGVHTGLLLAAHSEGELVSVLAHEIAHVTQRHLVRAFEASNRMSLPTLGALIAAIVLGANNPQVGEAVLASSAASSAQQQLTHSRSNEQEADNIGLDLMINANYDPHAMVSFFETLQNSQRLTEFSAPEFLRTHPLTLGRIADARNRAAQYKTSTQRDNTNFELIQARVAALAWENSSTQHTENTGKADWGRTAQQYYKALSSQKSPGNKEGYAEARTTMRQLTQANSHRLLFPYSAAQIELADNHPEQAKTILAQALTLFPGNLSLIELYADTLLRLQQPQIALDILKEALRKHPEQYRLYQAYAIAAKALGIKSEAYRALAELQYAEGNLYQAVDYLEQALATPGLSSYDRLTLQARQEMLKIEVKQREQSVSQSPTDHLIQHK